MKTFPFYRDVYYPGKLSYDRMRNLSRSWKQYRYNEIVRVGPSWIRPHTDGFLIYPCYSMLMRRVNRRRTKK